MLKILPPVWFMLFFVTALTLHFFVPAAHVFNTSFPYSLIIGFVVFAAGFYVPLSSSKIFAEEKNEILPTSPTNRVLIERGPYRFSRNPMYLGMVIMLIGVAVMLGTLPMYLAALAQFCVLNFVFVPFEEQKLSRLFGESYAAYRSRVRRWL